MERTELIRREKDGCVYLEYELPENADSVTTDMLQYGEIPGLFQPIPAQKDGKRLLLFPLRDRISLETAAQSGVPGGVRSAVNAFCDASLAVRRYMLDPDSILWDLSRVYYSPETGKTGFLCLPGRERTEGAEEPRLFAEKICGLFLEAERTSFSDRRLADAIRQWCASCGERPDYAALRRLSDLSPGEEGKAALFEISSGETFLVDGNVGIVGRDASVCGMRLSGHPCLSRKHAELRLTDGGWSVTDLGSTNGSVLNGASLTPARPYTLHNGDRLTLAGQEYIFCC